jgi:hypothetical protein
MDLSRIARRQSLPVLCWRGHSVVSLKSPPSNVNGIHPNQALSER